MRSLRGATLVEVVIAIVILAVGLLGLVATAGVTTRMIGEGARYGDVAALAVRRFEMLRSQGCDGTGGGSRTLGRLVETWTVHTRADGRVREARVVVTWPSASGVRADTFATTMLC